MVTLHLSSFHRGESSKKTRYPPTFSSYALCMERLSRQILQLVDYQQWKSIKLSNKGSQFSHLLFADDITFTSKITTSSVHTIIDTLSLFTQKSGQSINFTKSRIYFSSNATILDKSFVLSSFNMREGV